MGNYSSMGNMGNNTNLGNNSKMGIALGTEQVQHGPEMTMGKYDK